MSDSGSESKISPELKEQVRALAKRIREMHPDPKRAGYLARVGTKGSNSIINAPGNRTDLVEAHEALKTRLNKSKVVEKAPAPAPMPDGVSVDLEGIDMHALQRALKPRLTKYIPFDPTPKQTAFLVMNNVKEVLYGGSAGGGKALNIDTPLLTNNGWKTMGTVHVGDKVYDENGEWCNVVAKSDVQYDHMVYRVHFDNRTTIDADADHLWTLAQYRNMPCNKTMTTQELLDTMGNRTTHALKVAAPLVGKEMDLIVPPYVLGAWLGDGSSTCGDIASRDVEIIEEITKLGYECHKKSNSYSVYGLHTGLRELGVLNNKHIPEVYLQASYEQKLALLHGLMDTDGNASSDKGYCSICMVKKDLMLQIEFLVRSLGIKVTLTESVATCTNSKVGYKCPKYVLKWSTDVPMFRLPYKLARQKTTGFRGTQKLHYIKKIELIESVPVQCIKVDSSSHLFLVGKALIPTHNSIAQLMAALQFVDIPGYSAILFRKTYSDLSLPGALIAISKEWLMPFVDKKEVHWSEKDKKYTFPSGATLAFGYLEGSNDCFRYQGAAFQYIGFDECTHIAPSNYRYLFSRLRKTKDLKVPLRFRATCNPGGEYGQYYYERFFKEGPEKGRVFIPAGLVDNPHLDAEQYRAALSELDPITRAQLEDGNWEIKQSGNMFDRKWFLTVPSTHLPEARQLVRFWDMASTDPSKRKRTSDKRSPDWTVGLKLSTYQGLYWIEDIARVQKKPHDTEQLVAECARFDGYKCAVRMEQEPGSSGDMSIDNYARKVLDGYNFLGVRSTGSKVQRAEAVSSAAQAGRIMITENCRNKLEFFDEAEVFPYGEKDDMVDALSGAFNHFRKPCILAAPSSSRKAAGSYWNKI